MNLKTNKKYFIYLIIVLSIGVLFKLLPFIFLANGKHNLEKSQYVNAYKSLKRAYSLEPENKDIRYNYTLSLTKLSPTIKIQKELYRLSESSQNDSAQYLAKQFITNFRQKILYNYSDNYIDQVSNDNGIVRWSDETFPLKIHINDFNVNVPEYYNIEIFKALKTWEQSVDFLQFKKVDNASKADIVISMEPLPDDVCSGNYCKYVVGFTEPKIDKNILKRMEITLYDKDPRGRYFSDKEIFNTILHEMGHALGIMGHSYNPNDIMHMSTEHDDFEQQKSSFQYLTQSDRNTVKLLYRMLPDVSNVSVNSMNTKGLIYPPIVLGNKKLVLEKKITEARNYIKNAPQFPAGYIDLAGAYAQSGDVNLAIKTLKNGLNRVRRDDDRYMLYYNLAVISINNQDYKEAQKYLDEAKKIKSNTDTDKLQKMILR